jgi:hypothetical protein
MSSRISLPPAVLMKALRKLKNSLLPGGFKFRRVLAGPAAGCLLRINFHYHMPLFLGYYECELNSHIKQLVRPGFKCFDVGSQHGYEALIFARLTGQQVLSIDCDPAAVTNMRETVVLNHSPIEVLQAFVCDRSGTGQVTIDDLAEQKFTPDFIKVDIEGAEAIALSGAHSVLARRKPHLIIETHGLSAETECIDILSSFGYEPKIVNPRRLWPDRRLLNHNRWLICTGNEPDQSKSQSK